MASPAAILRAAKAVPGGARPTAPPQGVPGWSGALSPLSRELATADGYASAYGGFLPRPPQDFTAGAFGPFSPILPVPVDSPEDNGLPEPRREQYEVGWNLPVGQPGTEGVGKLASFATLRTIADLYSVARACIQLRKNEIRGIEWDIAPTPDAAKAMRNSPDAMKDFGARRGKAIAFFRRPDPDYFSWASWIDDVLEQMFVFDALSVFVAPKRGKGLGKGLLGSDVDCLQLIDGQTIRPLYDLHGATPRPPAPAYQQYLYGVPRSDFTTVWSGRDIEEAGLSGKEAARWRSDQLLYLPFTRRRWTPYGFTPVERALIPIMSGLQKQGWQLDYFRQGTVPAVYVSPGDMSMTPNQIRELQDALNAIAGDPAWHHKIIVLPPGSKTMPQRDAQLADAFDEIVRVDTCMGFDVEPMELGISPKVSTTQSSGAANQMAKMAQSKVDRKSTGPILRFLASICDYILRDVCGQDDMRFVFDGFEEEDDEQTKTQMLVQQVGAALASIDEGRQELGRQPWGLPETQDPIIITPTGPVSLVQALTQASQPPALPPAQGNGEPPEGGAPGNPPKPPVPPQGGSDGNAGQSPGHDAAEAAHEAQASGSAAPPKAARAELDALARHLRNGRDIATWQPVHLPAPALAVIGDCLAKGMTPADAVGVARVLILPAGDYEWLGKDGNSPKDGDAPGSGSGPAWPGWEFDLALAGIYAERLTAAFRAAIQAVRQIAARWLTSGGKSPDATVAAIRKAVAEALRPVLRSAWTEGYVLGQQSAAAMIAETAGPDWGDWKPGDPEAAAKVADAQGLEDLLSDYGIDEIKSVSDTGTDDLAALLSDALSDGSSSGSLARKITDLLNLPERAPIIAQAEIARAVSAATLDRYADAGVTAKEWLIAPEGACVICKANARQGAIPLEDDFRGGVPSPPQHPRCRCALAPAEVHGASLAGKSVRVVDLNGQEAIRDRRQDDTGGYAAGGGAAGVRQHNADGIQQDIPGGVPGPTAGGEFPRWDGSSPEPRIATVPDDEDDADYPEARGVPSRPGTYWPATYMDGYWPQGGHGTQQAGTSSPGGGGPRGRAPNGAGKSATVPSVAGLAILAADTGRVLMLQRALTDDDPAAGTWEFPGGHAEPGETLLQAALREWSEETGCQVPRGSLTGSWDAGNGIYRGFVLTVPSEAGVPVFDGRDATWNPDDPDGDLTEALAWWDPAQLRDNPSVRLELAADLGQVLAALAAGGVPAAVKAAGHERDTERLRQYWEHGEGAAKIRWGEPGDWQRCVDELGKHIADAEGYCNLMHHRVLGVYPATHAAMDRGK